MSHARYDFSTSSSQKRARANSSSFNASCAPALPKIDAEHFLQVFTHRSLRRPGPSSQDMDNERLAYLGQSALNVAVVEVLWSRRPEFSASEVEGYTEHLLGKPRNVIADWVNHYELRKKMRCDPSVYPKLWSDEETKAVFYAYTGAVFLKSGSSGVRNWIDKLLQDEDLASLKEESNYSGQTTVQIPASKKPKSELASPPPPMFVGSQPLPSQPPRPPLPPSHAARPPPPHIPFPPTDPAPPPPPRPASRSTMPNPLAPAQPNLPFLPLFNQTAAQRRVTVEYPAELSGPPQAVRWTVKCVVNGICKGKGVGSSKGAAKEEAAREAYYAMGWT